MSTLRLLERLEALRGQLRCVCEELTDRIPSPVEAAALLKAAEQAGRAVESVQLAAVLAADRANVALVGAPSNGAGHSMFKDTVDYLATTLHLRRGQARSRLEAARALLPREGISGPPLPSSYPELARAVTDGDVPVSTAMNAVNAIEKLKPVLARKPGGGAAELEKLEKNLAQEAREHTPENAQVLINHHAAHLDVDGQEPDEATRRALQGAVHIGVRFGLHTWRLVVDREQNELLKTAMATHTNPRIRNADGTPATGAAAQPNGAATGTGRGLGAGPDDTDSASGTAGDGARLRKPEWVPGPEDMPDASFPPDAPAGERTRAQKQLDGVVDAIALALAGGKLPATGGMKPQVIVTIDYQTLLGQVADAATRTSTSTLQGRFSPAVIRRMACDADIIPVVLGGHGEVLDLGRTQRLFNTEQRKALIARDGGCTGPACTITADMCEAHHIVPWSHGGPTDVANGTILCRYHHAMIHDSDWTIETHAGIPYWIPPPYIDPRQPRLRNTYFQPHHHKTLF